MYILKRVFFLVLILVVLTGLKHLLDKYSPASTIFHYNFLTCLQYFLLIGVLLWVVLQGIFYLRTRRRLKAKWFWLIFLGLLTCSEAFFYFKIRNSNDTSRRFHDMLTEYYLLYEINFPKLTYDPELSYTLRKNSVYVHDNIEFSNDIRVNSAGLRDDSASLVKPDVICLGDSYTMGWGVPAEKAFPHLIENKTGLKVLNAGISSYGTARELLLLNRLDTSKLKYLIIQYCYNDQEENESFLKNNRYLPVGSQESRDRIFRSYQFARTYFPFKYTLTILRMYVRNKILAWRGENSNTRSWTPSVEYVPSSADAFLRILDKSNVNFNKWKIILIDMNRYPAYDHHFLDTVEARINKAGFSNDLKNSIHIVKFPELNVQRYFYPLDNHLNEAGHELIADKILVTGLLDSVAGAGKMR